MSYFTESRPEKYRSWSTALSSSGSESDEVDTPLTERAVLFGEDANATINSESSFILVVGGCGYIGSHTVLELAKSGFSVVVIDNFSNSFRSVFDTVEVLVSQHYDNYQPRRKPRLILHEADFRDTDRMSEILQTYSSDRPPKTGYFTRSPRSSIIGVIHFAAYKAVAESIKTPLEYYSNNVAGLISLCALLDSFSIKTLVFSSSATVYGTVADLGYPLREEYCTQKRVTFVDNERGERVVESGSSGLTSPYGRSKWMCEAILSDIAISDPAWKITALRYFNPIGCDKSGILGEDPRSGASNLMPVLVQILAGERKSLSVFGTDWDTPDGTAVRDYIHVTDLAKGHIAALSCSRPAGFETYNLGCGVGCTVLEVVSAMEAASGRIIPLHFAPRRHGDVGSCVAEAKKAEKELAWQAEKDLKTSCEDVWRFVENAWGMQGNA